MDAVGYAGERWSANKIWLVFSVFFTLVLAISGISAWADSRNYRHEGRRVIGEVIGITPQDHYQISTRYFVEGRSYKIVGSFPGNLDRCRVGDRVPVYYLASRPQDGFLSEPEFHPVALTAGWISLIFALRGFVALGLRFHAMLGRPSSTY